MAYTFHGSEMRSLRKEDLSLYYHLKHVGLFEFIEVEELAPLNRLETEDFCYTDFKVYEAMVEWCENPDGFTPDPTERGRGWVYLDSGTVESGTGQCAPYVVVPGTDMEGNSILGIPEQSDRITVYQFPTNAIVSPVQYTTLDVDNAEVALSIDGVEYLLTGEEVIDYVVPESDYMVDYIDGRIVLAGTSSWTPTHITYAWHYISLVDEWAAVEAANPPVVVIDMHGTDKAGYQLGGGKMQTRKVDLHVFATNPAERNDIVEELVDSLFNKSAPLYDFPLGTMLEYDGTWYGRTKNPNKLTSLFNRQHASHVIGNMEFLNVTSRHVSLPLVMTRDRNEVMLSDLNAYRSKVSFDLVTYTYV